PSLLRIGLLLFALGGICVDRFLISPGSGTGLSMMFLVLVMVAALGLLPPFLERDRLHRYAVSAFEDGRTTCRVMFWQRLKLTPEGLLHSTAVSTTRVVWDGIERIGMTDHHAFFYLTPVSSLILPRRAFASEEEFERFVEMARIYHN